MATTEKKQLKEVKTSKQVVISPEDWESLVQYVSSCQVPFKDAEKAVRAKQAIVRARLIDLTVKDK